MLFHPTFFLPSFFFGVEVRFFFEAAHGMVGMGGMGGMVGMVLWPSVVWKDCTCFTVKFWVFGFAPAPVPALALPTRTMVPRKTYQAHAQGFSCDVRTSSTHPLDDYRNYDGVSRHLSSTLSHIDWTK